MLPISHIAAPLLCLSIYDKYLKAKKRKRIPLYFFILIGIAGILPDLLAVHLLATERASFSHSLLFPLIFLAAYFVLGKAKQKYSVYALLFFIGVSIHFVLDLITAQMYLFYPFSMYAVSQLVVMPAYAIVRNGTVYLSMIEHAVWYATDAVFFISFVLVEKTAIVERICAFFWR